MHFYGGVVGTALAAVRENTKFNRHIVGATLRGRPNGIIYNAKNSAQSRAGACSRRKMSILNIDFGGLWASRPTFTA